MTSQLRLLATACGLVLFAGIVATFVVDGDDADLASADRATGTTTTAVPEGRDDGGDVGDGTAAPGDASSTTVAAQSTTTVAGETTTSAPTTSAAPTTTAAPGTTAAPDAPARTPTAPGTYTYDVDGCCDQNGEEFSGESTLTVEAVAADGTQRHITESQEGRAETVYRYAPEGRYLVSMQFPTPCGVITFQAMSPFLLIPADADAGTRTTGQLEGGGLRADVVFEIVSVGEAESTARNHADVTGTLDCGALGKHQVEATMDMDVRARSTDQLPLESTSTTEVTKPSIGAGTTTVHSVLRR